MNPNDLRKADAIEVVIGQGAKPGGGGMLLGQKINDRVAALIVYNSYTSSHRMSLAWRQQGCCINAM